MSLILNNMRMYSYQELNDMCFNRETWYETNQFKTIRRIVWVNIFFLNLKPKICSCVNNTLDDTRYIFKNIIILQIHIQFKILLYKTLSTLKVLYIASYIFRKFIFIFILRSAQGCIRTYITTSFILLLNLYYNIRYRTLQTAQAERYMVL